MFGISAAAATVVGAVGGGLIAANATKNAARGQAAAANRASDLQDEQYQQTRADNVPLLDARNNALSRIQALLADPSTITKDPGYSFGLNQGTKALNNSAAARGMTYSGAQGKALMRYGNDYAGSKIDQTYNRLSNIAGLGQVGANNNQHAGMNYANNVGNNMMGAANVNAAAGMSNANLAGNTLNQLSAYGNRNGWFNSGASPVLQNSDAYNGYQGDYNSLGFRP